MSHANRMDDVLASVSEESEALDFPQNYKMMIKPSAAEDSRCSQNKEIKKKLA